MDKTNLDRKILVIIVTWNKKEYVIDLLTSLANINYPRSQFDIVVVDNASTDGTVQALEQHFSDVHLLVNSENLGGTGGFNTGLDWAFAQPEGRYDYLWLLDNDVVVHKNSLTALIETLEQNPDAAVVGSTMLQLDYPWRINEMGAFVDKSRGALILNRHIEEIPSWRIYSIEQLLVTKMDLTALLRDCQPIMDVDYVAAASLLVRAPVARQAGLWKDFFIHFDDVEWCLRIAKMGHRVLVSARSLIWHLSAAAKVPSWILYYDNRNILYLLVTHGEKNSVKEVTRWITLKALYYALLGKQDLSKLHLDAIEDFKQQITGKKAIQLNDVTKPVSDIKPLLLDPSIRRVLIPYTVNMQASDIQSILVKAMKQRHDLTVFYICPPAHLSYPKQQVPGVISIHISRFKLVRYWQYFKLKGQFDIVFQSDYQPVLPISWLAKQTVFINDNSFCVRDKPRIRAIIKTLRIVSNHYFD